MLIYLLRGVATWNRGRWVLLLICLMHLLLFLLHPRDLSSMMARWSHCVSSCLIGGGLLAASFPKKERKEKGCSNCYYQYLFEELLRLLKNLIFLRSEIERISIRILSLKWLICLFLIANLHFVCKLDIKSFLIILLPRLLISEDQPSLFYLIKLLSIGWIDRRIVNVL